MFVAPFTSLFPTALHFLQMSAQDRIYLHRGNETPWAYNTEEEIKMLYQKVLSKLNKTTINKICKNENQHTSIILTKCV